MKRVGQIYRERLVSNVNEGAANKKNVFLISYSKLSSLKLSDLRKSLRLAGADVHATKNSIARKVLKDLNQAELASNVKDQTVFVWTDADCAAVSKVLKKCATDYGTLAIGGGVIEGRYVNPEDVKKLADLPSREVLLAKLLGTLQAPASRLAGALNGKTREVLSILKQASEKKGGQ